MMTYERAQVATLLDRLGEVPERLIVVTGPRQTGKTTLVRQALDRIGRPHRPLPARGRARAGDTRSLPLRRRRRVRVLERRHHSDRR